jgi:hypothetical protein
VHDPSRYPQWWAGVEAVSTGPDDGFTLWPTSYPDFPMPQRLRTEPADGRVVISCLVSDLEFRWQLSVLPGGTGIEVTVRLPEAEAHRLPAQQEAIERSLAKLVRLAAAGG